MLAKGVRLPGGGRTPGPGRPGPKPGSRQAGPGLVKWTADTRALGLGAARGGTHESTHTSAELAASWLQVLGLSSGVRMLCSRGSGRRPQLHVRRDRLPCTVMLGNRNGILPAAPLRVGLLRGEARGCHLNQVHPRKASRDVSSWSLVGWTTFGFDGYRPG